MGGYSPVCDFWAVILEGDRYYSPEGYVPLRVGTLLFGATEAYYGTDTIPWDDPNNTFSAWLVEGGSVVRDDTRFGTWFDDETGVLPAAVRRGPEFVFQVPGEGRISWSYPGAVTNTQGGIVVLEIPPNRRRRAAWVAGAVGRFSGSLAGEIRGA